MPLAGLLTFFLSWPVTTSTLSSKCVPFPGSLFSISLQLLFCSIQEVSAFSLACFLCPDTSFHLWSEVGKCSLLSTFRCTKSTDLCFSSIFSESEFFSPFYFITSLLPFCALQKILSKLQSLVSKVRQSFSGFILILPMTTSSGSSPYQLKMHIISWLVHFCYLHPYFLIFEIVTIIILEFACHFRASSPSSTRAKALDEAYSQYKRSGTNKAVKRQFPGSPNQYSISQFTKFILQHRLWQSVSIFWSLYNVYPLYALASSQLTKCSVVNQT